MVISFQEATEGHFDFCIIGSGPAGLVLAMELERRQPSASILIVEAGGMNTPWSPNPLDDSIDNRNPINHHPPEECTNKLFGGTSLTWGGRCVSYDEIDFLPRPIVGENCTWDLAIFEDVKRFYEPAAKLLECGRPVFDLGEINASRISENFQEGEVTDSTLERWSLPTRFNALYKDQTAASKQIQVVPGCLAMEIVMLRSAEHPSTPPTNPSSNSVTQLLVKEISTNKTSQIQANKFIIAAGAQESTRLLLKSPSLFPNGAPDALGKFYQSHVSGKIASIKFTGNPKKTDFGFTTDSDGTYTRRRLQLTTESLEKNNLLNTAFWLDNGLYHDPSHRNGTMSFIYLAMITPIIGKKLAPAAIANSVTHGRKAKIGAHIWNVIRGFPRSFYEPAKIMLGRYFGKRRLPGVFLYSRLNDYALHFHAEQIPHEANRMSLDGDKLVIEYGYRDEDIDSVIRSHQVLDDHLRKTGAGELRYWYPEHELADHIRNESKDGIHQNGTTRMSIRPEDGVVDPNLKLWARDNVFVCSSSVFPTSGQANPTFLLCAFAARLADHVAR